jgi:hypothetical protein
MIEIVFLKWPRLGKKLLQTLSVPFEEDRERSIPICDRLRALTLRSVQHLADAGLGLVSLPWNAV